MFPSTDIPPLSRNEAKKVLGYAFPIFSFNSSKSFATSI